ncbi:MAG: hypothetical protein MI723_13875 [Caulobacterales bacterium]|nr:hypothetical protein [Caulobacterales bacterium]
MKLLRAATLTVADPAVTAARYHEWLDYASVEAGQLSADLAAAWGRPASAGRAYEVLQPASGAEVYLRLVEGEVHPDYRALRTYGWAAIEICVEDVLAVNERMQASPFEIIGPPREIEGLPAIYPMQVKGPDQEIAYFTQIREDLPAYDLPRAAGPIDKLFILVIACSDMQASLDWFANHIGFPTGRVMDIEYTMLADAFGTPRDELHTISTAVHDRDVFLELDQYPPAATVRPGAPDALPQGVAIGTFLHPDLDAVTAEWIAPPARRDGPIYGGRRAGAVRAPDDTIVELVQL